MCQICFKIVSDSQLFVDKTMFLEKKAPFFMSKTVNQRSGENKKKTVFCRNLQQISCFFRFFAAKTLKMTILTRVWCAQHPNAGGNIQQLTFFKIRQIYVIECFI